MGKAWPPKQSSACTEALGTALHVVRVKDGHCEELTQRVSADRRRGWVVSKIVVA